MISHYVVWLYREKWSSACEIKIEPKFDRVKMIISILMMCSKLYNAVWKKTQREGERDEEEKRSTHALYTSVLFRSLSLDRLFLPLLISPSRIIMCGMHGYAIDDQHPTAAIFFFRSFFFIPLLNEEDSFAPAARWSVCRTRVRAEISVRCLLSNHFRWEFSPADPSGQRQLIKFEQKRFDTNRRRVSMLKRTCWILFRVAWAFSFGILSYRVETIFSSPESPKSSSPFNSPPVTSNSYQSASSASSESLPNRSYLRLNKTPPTNLAALSSTRPTSKSPTSPQSAEPPNKRSFFRFNSTPASSGTNLSSANRLSNSSSNMGQTGSNVKRSQSDIQSFLDKEKEKFLDKFENPLRQNARLDEFELMRTIGTGSFGE